MTCILAFSSAICESIRFRGARISAVCAGDAAIESVVSKYDVKLFEEFGVLGCYYESTGDLTDSVAGDIEKNLYPEKEFLLLKNTDFWKLGIEEVVAEEYSLMTDAGGEEFFKQAVLYAKNNIGVNLVEMLVDYANNNEDPDKVEEYFETEEQETEKQIQEYEKQAENEELEKDYEYSGEIIEVDESPVDTVKLIKQRGILALVIPENNAISGNFVDLTACVSQRSLREGSGSINNESSLTDKAMYIEYLTEMFTDFNSNSSSSEGFNYQLEYCIGGKETDEANMKFVVNRLLLIREAANFTYLMTDSNKKSQALAVAAGLVGATGIQPLVEAVKYAILLAWAYAESIMDVRNLLSGGSTALIKTADNWKLGIENLANIASAGSGPVQEKYGLDYTSYLKLLLMFHTKEELVMRSMDLVELRMQQIYDAPEYKLDCLLTSVSIRVYYCSQPLFLKFGFMKSFGYDTDFDVTTKYTYI